MADDDPLIRHLVTSLVRKDGYEAVEVEDGREAIRVLQRDADFGAAIFDMVMPHIDGIEVIRHMRTEKRLMRIPVMMITSGQDYRLMKTGFGAGAAVLLPRPFTTTQLRTMLRMIVGRGRAAPELPTK
ncbi:MAG: response regulator [Acidobacteriota bacterium]|nr:response regulator [Acidobacteriota bacterium]